MIDTVIVLAIGLSILAMGGAVISVFIAIDLIIVPRASSLPLITRFGFRFVNRIERWPRHTGCRKPGGLTLQRIARPRR